MKGKNILKLTLSLILIAVLGYTAFNGIGDKKIGGAPNISLGLDLAGGVSITYEAVTPNPTDAQMNDAVYKIRKRVDSYSTEAEVYREGSNRINADIPGVTDANKVLEELGKPGALEFRDEAGNIVINGADIKSADAASYQGATGQVEYVVRLALNDAGAKKFSDATAVNVGKRIAIYYDNELISAPVVQQQITGGEASISGMESFNTADKLASTIRIGALPVELRELRSNVVGAKLGQEAINKSLLAGAIGLALVVIFMIIAYRIPGLASSLALLIYTALMVITLSLFKITLTLPGIAGIILSIGMAVDANVIIFARVKEELAHGKTVRSSIKSGFSKALSAIVDGNVTTLIAAGVLWVKGTGPIKGFAQTLTLGIVVSMFTALVITKFLLTVLYELGLNDPKFFGIQKPFKYFKFVEHRRKFFVASLIVIITGFIFMPVNKAQIGSILNYGLDFKGGTTTQVTFNENYSFEQIDNEIKPLVAEITGDAETQAQKVTGTNDVLIKTKELNLEQRKKLEDTLVEKYGVDKTLITSESISPTVSGEMKVDAIVSVLIASVLMLIYIAFRFKDVAFGTSAIIALLHDVLVILAVYSVAKLPINSSFIACILTILGYSINDTIVVFDRMRENKATMKPGDTVGLINSSTSQTLTRSIYTSLTTFFTVAVLYVLGVASVKEFALPLMVGILSGTYSSIFIAAPLWHLFRGKKN